MQTGRSLFALVSVMTMTLAGCSGERLQYPETKKVDQVDDYHGTRIADPYRWLEDADSAETASWVATQNKVTFSYLEQVPERERIGKLLTKLWDYERFGVPSKEGPYYIYTRNDGLQNQAVLYRTSSLDGAADVLLDPNTLSADGTVALSGLSFAEDGKHVAYGLAASGSDWVEWHVRDVATAKDLPDLVRWSKFSGAAWKKDGTGFYYGAYDPPKEGTALQGVNKNQKLYFHAVGTTQDKDVLVYERPDRPDWMFGADTTDDGRFLVIYQSEGTEPKNRVFLRDLSKPDAAIEPFLDDFDAEYTVVGNDGDLFYVKTDKDAPRGRLVAIARQKPASSQARARRITAATSGAAPVAGAAGPAVQELIAQGPGKEVLSAVTMVANRFVVVWQTDAHEQVKVYGLDGRLEREIALPGLGTVGQVNGRRAHSEGFYAFTSYTYPTTVYRYDVAAGRSSIFRQPKVPFDASRYETRQVFYNSKDGTRVPMFITARKGLPVDGSNPTLLYGYGGFNISMTPGFSPATAAWLELGGVYAVANIRGGAEYGKEWHDGGRLKNKQNVFDDFIAAAEYLIREKYTSTPKLAIFGGSNGGLLVGACMTQRPDLFGAALPAVGVMDMLRFDEFTIGWAWRSDYGSARKSPEEFATLVKYSPLHNLKPGTSYPATLVTTADHDDRVVPAHSFKFIAALQAAHAGERPVLIRIETKAGHGAGKPTTKQIEEARDRWAFLVRVLKMRVPASIGS